MDVTQTASWIPVSRKEGTVWLASWVPNKESYEKGTRLPRNAGCLQPPVYAGEPMYAGELGPHTYSTLTPAAGTLC